VFERYKVLLKLTEESEEAKLLVKKPSTGGLMHLKFQEIFWGLKKNILSIFSQLKSIKSRVFFLALSQIHRQAHLFV